MDASDRAAASFHAAPDPILMLDASGRIMSINAAGERTLGLMRGAPGRDAALLVASKEDRARFTDALQAALEGRRGAPFEAHVRDSDALTFPAEITIRSAPGGMGVTCFCFLRDVTSRRLAQEQLLAARRAGAESEKLAALGTLVSGVAHEIRTPLAYIQNNLYILRSRLDFARAEERAPEDMTEFITASLEGVERIRALVESLKRQTRLDAGARTDESLDHVAAEAVSLFRAAHRGASPIGCDLAPTPPVRMNRLQVQQIVLNLLENAADATEGHGALRIKTRAVGMGGAELVVEDDGPGIPAALRERIFDPFFTTKATGTGLGLSIVKRIVGEHGGKIACESQPGQGTAFFVSFPSAPPA